ncbi:asparagine synthase (glutamine-hydrolyzing) [Streptomyces sp. AV19]|uniref:asparagine synthase (glutamine-hydrolyzing) n=1 Tax=Streptomyces sp. AV19 TaxID=2793068 RepID=UPI0018FEDB10|nr:asparagine synthase (glutamine-hydrolyzing) [Streptomyces sp. AV19]MBH1938107.1 asparagine synthase (glutamine-hydrolyzing) [Streptomyces sp. AV19]MDG4536128.1 asparagine synthase (glutamine-hydrolyzing) [Streptomyces sp. AV19]
MCGITGWVAFSRDLSQQSPVVGAMTDTLDHRGPDARGLWLGTHAALGHRRLSIIDLEHGTQPMLTPEQGPDGLPRAVISYGGEIYNFRELREELALLGHKFTTRSDTEVALRGYLQWGADLVHRLNGMYSLAIWDTAREELLLVRDRLGVKPLFYYPTDDGVLFGSEPKAILANPLARARAGGEELCDALLFLRTPGRVPFRGMHEVKPGHLLRVGRDGIREERYWRLASRPHTDDLKTTIATVRDLLDDIVPRQMIADVPLVSLLSGGLDSSTVTALAARTRAAEGAQLSTFSVDFTGHTENFRADAVRPTPDGPYAREVARHVSSDHHMITLDRDRLLDPAVRKAVLGAWDLPFNFADLDVSLYLLFAAVREHATVALSGEGADEVFGGYLWFSDPGARAAETFPWLKLGAHRGLDPRSLFHPWFIDGIDLAEYEADLYRTALAEVPLLDGENAADRRTRELGHLTLTRWLPILLDKKDRMGMASGLEGRVPFCDHRLVEYVFNVPWEMKNFGGQEKALLRAAAADLLPESVLRRKKAAYPSIQDPAYDRALITGLATAADGEAGAPLAPFLDGGAVRRLTDKTAEGSLSEFERILVESTSRMDDWLRTYQVELTGVKGTEQ